jgi:nicotinic acid phosphoribosyltransferase
MNYLDYGLKTQARILAMLKMEGVDEIPQNYTDFMKLDHQLRKFIGCNLPLVLSDDYEHFMACLPNRKYGAQHVLIRKQIGGFTVAAGFWKWLEFLSQPLNHNYVNLMADFMSGKHNGFKRQFNKEYWDYVVHDCGGYLPIRIETVGEGAVFTGVPFPVAQVYGEVPPLWLPEPMYIQNGQLTHVATIAAQFAEALGDPWRFIEVAFRAMQTREFSDDMLLAMLIGGGIISTSNDLGAFINGAPFKCAGTTGHCWYQQRDNFKEALRVLLQSPLGPFSTVLLDIVLHEFGFAILQELIAEGYPPPFAERPDSGDVVKTGLENLVAMEDEGHRINVVFEDGKGPADALDAEKRIKMLGLEKERALFGAGSAFFANRSVLEPAYKAAHFHDGTPENPIDELDTMKICLNAPEKGSIPGMISYFQNEKTGIYQLGVRGQSVPSCHQKTGYVLYDGLNNPGHPYFNPDYDCLNLTGCKAITDGIDRSKKIRKLLGPSFTLDIGPNKNAIGMTTELRQKKKRIYSEAMRMVKERG